MKRHVVVEIDIGMVLAQAIADNAVRSHRDLVSARAVAADGDLLRKIETAGQAHGANDHSAQRKQALGREIPEIHGSLPRRGRPRACP